MTMLAARASRSSRKDWRPPSISLAVVGSVVPWAKRARLAMSSGRSGSSIQYGWSPSDSNARAILSAVGRFQSPWSSTIMSIRSPTVWRTWRKGSSPLSSSAAVMFMPARGVRVLVERPHLHAGHALREKALGQLARAPVEEGVEVLVGTLAARRRRQAPVLEHLALVGPRRTGSPRRCCRRGSPGGSAPPRSWTTGRPAALPGQVPQRDVHGGVAARLHAGAPGADVLREGDAEAVDRRGVLPEQPQAAVSWRYAATSCAPKKVSPRPTRPASVWRRTKQRLGNSPSWMVSSAVMRIGSRSFLEAGQPLMAPLVSPLTK